MAVVVVVVTVGRGTHLGDGGEKSTKEAEETRPKWAPAPTAVGAAPSLGHAEQTCTEAEEWQRSQGHLNHGLLLSLGTIIRALLAPSQTPKKRQGW